ncbi:MAG: cation:proton antiporter [Pyrobaculum sp.]
MDFPLGSFSIAVLFGVLFAYLFDRVGFPPFLGFFVAGVLASILVDLSISDVYLQILLALVAFEVGRQLGTSGLSPAAFFAVILETAFIIGISIILFRIVGFTIHESIIVAVMMLSSSSLLAIKLSQSLPPEARAVVLSLTTLEDAVLFFSLSLLFGSTTIETLPINLFFIVAMSIIALGVFTYVYRYIIGRDYALPFALAIAFGFVYIVQYFQIASPFLGAFIGGYLFSRADTHGIHMKEASALSGLIIYLYMLVVGISMPVAVPNVVVLALSLAIAFAAVFVRALAVFLASLLVIGQPKTSTNVALSSAHISELSLSIPIVAYKFNILKNVEHILSLALAPVLTLFIAPFLWRYRERLEIWVGGRFRELRTTVAYEKLYRVVTHAFITATKLAILSLVLALSVAYLGLLSIIIIVPAGYYLLKFSRELYKDLLLALREFKEARYTSAAVLISTFALSAYVVFALIMRVGEIHLYTVAVIIGVLVYSLLSIYSGLRAERAK